jgi:predicted ATP-grasp superfamily ATP-dependent carboligase/CelD/BcsL family acetyltransferase involved in cellulose biosynthesis
MTGTASLTTVREASAAEREPWDILVRRFPHRVTHTRAWIESLAASGCGRPVFLLFERDGDVVGCLPGLLSSMVGWRLFGSPLPGWQTVSMGPVFDPARLCTAELVQALIPFLEERYGVAHIELLHSGLDPAAMRATGFEGEPVFTYRAVLHPEDEQRAWRALKESARRNVRRAERLGLVVRFEHDERFVDEHFRQLCAVYRRGGYAIPFTKRRVLECFRHMQRAGCLLATAAYLPGGRVCIATGMFLLEGTELLLWMWAHDPRYRWYRPTEIMTWAAMRHAMAAGCSSFDLMGRGEFKEKFGAEPDLTKWRWMRSRPRWLAHARSVAETGFRVQQGLRGRLARFAARVAEAAREPVGGARGRGALPACVMGDIDLIRALGLAGVPTVAVAPPGDPARFSRFTRSSLDWLDSWSRADELVEVLLEHARVQPEPPVLFYQEDRGLLLVSRHRERLREGFRFVIPEAELVEQLVDKGRFQLLAERLHLPVPPARVFRPTEESPPLSLDLEYPVVLKPVTRRVDRWTPIAGDRKAIRIDGPGAISALWPQLAEAGLVVLIQAIVPGSETRVESYHVYVDASGVVVAEFTGRKLRTQPVSLGDSTALEITDAADVARVGRDIVRRLGLRGVAKLDFKRGPDDALYLLEVNPRFTLWHHPAAVAGVNIPALVYGDLVGWPRPPVLRPRAGVRWCKVWTDRIAAREQGVSFLKWLWWALGCETKRALAWDDPMPILGRAAWHCWAQLWRTSSGRPAPVGLAGPVVEHRARGW